jgi:hypothetical protein
MTRRQLITFTLAANMLLGLLGCGEPSLESPEYGEIIHQVPADLNQPYPLPELESPATAADAPSQTSDETSAGARPAAK